MQPTFSITGALDDVLDHYEERGWTDGLPIVPPTPEAVAKMLEETKLEADHVVGAIPPRQADATVATIAINAVMAGCKAQYLSVVLAAVECLAEPALNLYGIQATTNPAAILLVVNGPIVEELRINGKGNCLGPGARANATIGRAVRLVMLNIGGGVPQTMDKATQGQPGKYTMCIAENAEESPWEPWHVERGFARDASTVTAVSVTGTQNILDGSSKQAGELIKTFASACAYVGAQNVLLGGGPLILVCPEHAAILAAGGYSKLAFKRALYEAARVPVRDFPDDLLRYMVHHRRPLWFRMADRSGAGVPLADSPESINVVVAGGAGAHSTLCESFGEMSSAVTKAIGRPPSAT